MKIIYVTPILSTFASLDIKGLQDAGCDVETLSHQWTVKWKTPLNIIVQAFWLAFNLFKYDCLIISFAGYHSIMPTFFARLYGKRLFYILNGTESVGLKHLKYGNLRSQPLKSIIKFCLFNATELWPVSDSLIFGNNQFDEMEYTFGVKYTFPELKTPSITISNGIELSSWLTDVHKISKRNFGIVTVVSGSSQFERKGIDLIVESAKILKHLNFIVIGMENAKNDVKNVSYLRRVTPSILKEIYSDNIIYLQVSRFEGFGVALIEAMAAGLIPIGSNVNAIPEIIGDSGFIIESANAQLLAETIQKVIDLSEADRKKLAQKAMKRVAEIYPIQKRIDTMIKRINYYYSSPSN